MIRRPQSGRPAATSRRRNRRSPDGRRGSPDRRRAVWFLLVIVAGPAFDAALGARSDAVVDVVTGGLWSIWLAGLIALAIPATVTLTAARLIAPLPLLAALTAVVAGGPSAAEAVLALGATALAAVSIANAELGRHFVQSAAYGDETRFPLRPPGALLAGPLPLFWLLTAAPCLAGPLLLAVRNWILGVPITALGVGAAVVARSALSAARSPLARLRPGRRRRPRRARAGRDGDVPCARDRRLCVGAGEHRGRRPDDRRARSGDRVPTPLELGQDRPQRPDRRRPPSDDSDPRQRLPRQPDAPRRSLGRSPPARDRRARRLIVARSLGDVSIGGDDGAATEDEAVGEVVEDDALAGGDRVAAARPNGVHR